MLRKGICQIELFSVPHSENVFKDNRHFDKTSLDILNARLVRSSYKSRFLSLEIEKNFYCDNSNPG
jgi:hypothetical protein